MGGGIPDEIERLLSELYEEGRRDGGMWNITPETGRLLCVLARSAGAKRLLEIGTSNGFSAIWVALAARDRAGTVTTTEVSGPKARLARENFKQAGVENVVEVINGAALDVIPAHSGPFDFVFLDADKGEQRRHLEDLLPSLAANALVVSDNVIDLTRSLTDYLDFVRNDPRFVSVMMPIGNGEEVSLYLGG